MTDFQPGARVWLASDDEYPFRLGTVVAPPKSLDPASRRVHVEADGSETTALASELLAANPEIQDDCDDIGRLSHLNEAALLHLVASRYRARQIYTRAGPVLVAFNPFTRVPSLYGAEQLARYEESAMSDTSAALAPHVYEVAAAAYGSLRVRGRSQSVIINGESGAGKTETTKIILRFLTHAAGGGGEELARRIHESSPVLEAFGNCKTLRNDNSSRFGKFLRLHFTSGGALCGGSVERYLLEKSRVVQQEPGERSFHAFYHLCAGASDAERARLQLRNPKEAAAAFALLTAGECVTVAAIDDVALHAEASAALDSLHAQAGAAADVPQLWALLAGVLHLGNVRFEADEGSGVAVGGGAVARLADDAKYAAAAAAALLGVEAGALLRALAKRTISAGGEEMELDKSAAEAAASRDALAKAIYERLFDRLVAVVNDCLGGAPAGAVGSIGLLDIFGSEVFETNSFEQLLINFANEKLQSHFTATAIGLVQQEYAREGIDVARIEYTDNAPVVALLEGKPLSLLGLLDDQCLQAGATDASFVRLLFSEFDSHAALGRARPGAADASFVVQHFAGAVTYTGASFLAKNKDALFGELPALMRASSHALARTLFAEGRSGGGGGGGAGGGGKSPGPVRRRKGAARPKATQFVSVGAQFRTSMDVLLSTLGASQSHFIRCIKPNDARAPFTLEPQTARTQLRSCGVLEAVRVSQAGFPTRVAFAELVARYGVLLPPAAAASARDQPGGRRGSTAAAASGGDALKALAVQLLATLGLTGDGDEPDYLLGRTLAFLRSGVLARAEEARGRHLGKCFARLQARRRARPAAAAFRAARKAAARLQARARGAAARRRTAVVRAEAAARRAEETARREAAAAAAAAAAAEAAAAETEAEAAEREAAEAAAAKEAAAEAAAAAAAKEQAAAEAAASAAAATEEVASYRDQLAEMRAALDEERALRLAAEEQTEKLELEVASLEEAQEESGEQMEEYEEEIVRLEDEWEAEADELARTRTRLAAADDERLRLLQEVKHLRSMLRERDAELHRSVQETTALKVRLAEAGLDTIDVGTPRGSAEPAAITKKSRSWFSPK